MEFCLIYCLCRFCFLAVNDGSGDATMTVSTRATYHDRIHHSDSSCTLYHLHLHPFLNREGRWGTTDEFTTSFLHLSLFSTALWHLANAMPVHSLMSSSHLFFCLSCLFHPFTVTCKMVLTRPDERETCPYHLCTLNIRTQKQSDT